MSDITFVPALTELFFPRPANGGEQLPLYPFASIWEKIEADGLWEKNIKLSTME